MLSTVKNLDDTAPWSGYTYLYVRMLHTPELYGVPVEAVDSDPALSVRACTAVT